MKKVDISFMWDWELLRQTPDSLGTWEDTTFTLNSNENSPDFWVIYDDIAHSQTRYIHSKHTILFTAEPESVKSYPKSFTDQFGLIVTSRSDIDHPNTLLTTTGLPWFTGRKVESDGSHSFVSTYNSLKSAKCTKKVKLASVISSDKSFTNGHSQRLEFAKTLKLQFGEEIDIFGRGINEFKDKADVLLPYRYHIVLENSREEHYWTEKLSDAFLNECYPIYYGCPNINEYFSKDAMTCINLDNFEESLKTIEGVINSDLDKEKRNDVLKAKDQCLDKYNLFPQIVQITNSALFEKLERGIEHKITTIRPQSSFR